MEAAVQSLKKRKSAGVGNIPGPAELVQAGREEVITALATICNKILRISYKDHVTSEEVRAKIQQVIGPHEDLLTIVKRCKLQWYGHVSRSSGLEDEADRGRGGKATSGNGQA